MSYKTTQPEYHTVPEGATHVTMYASAGDTAASPTHPSDPFPLEDFAEEGTVSIEEIDETVQQHMWETVRPEAWFRFTDADGNEIE